MRELYIGVMSGTSLDGVDIAFCDFSKEKVVELLHFESYPFDDELKFDILKVINGQTTLHEIGSIDERLGRMYAKHINDFLQKHSLLSKDIRVIGLHGQTLWHEPNSNYPFSMQLGNSNRVAYETGIAVVCDIRRKDMAAGGQGAPFAPVFHKFLFGHLGSKAAVVNIGGMANISILNDEVIGYDTGCGNVLIDGWCSKYFGIPYDKDGKLAKEGELDTQLLGELLKDKYFSMPHPKSTGREYFNLAWLENKLFRHPELVSGSKAGMLKQVQHDNGQVQDDKVDSSLCRNDDELSSAGLKHDIELKNVLRTLTELTAATIANEAKKFDRKLLVLSGGGAKNSFLKERITDLFGGEVRTTADLGLREDAIESMMMAYFAYLRVNNQKAELKGVTGAKENLILGGLYEAN